MSGVRKSASAVLAHPTLAYAGLAAVDTALASRGRPGGRQPLLRWVTKPVLMPLAMRHLHSRTGPERTALRRSTWLGLGLSGVGDVALLSEKDPAFLGGLGAFLAAHVSYMYGLVTTAIAEPRQVTPARALPAAGVAGVVGPVLVAKAGTMRWPVAAYALTISTMFGTALVASESLPRSAAWRIVLGTGLFVSSDSMIGAKKFLLDGRGETRIDPRVVNGAIMATYALGQILIADGVARATQPDQT